MARAILRSRPIGRGPRSPEERDFAGIGLTAVHTVIAALLDEVAFWRSDDSASPDTEIVAALRPAMSTIPDAMPRWYRATAWPCRRRLCTVQPVIDRSDCQ